MMSHQLVSKFIVLEKFNDSIRLPNRDDRNGSCANVKAALLVPFDYWLKSKFLVIQRSFCHLNESVFK